MTLASVSIMTSALILLGAFFVITQNLNKNTKNLNEQPEIQVFCDYRLDDSQVSEIEKQLQKHPRILKVSKISKQEAMNKVKEFLSNDPALFEGLTDDFLPISFIIKLKDPALAKLVADELQTLQGIKKVTYSQKVIELISKFVGWIQYFSAVLVILLMIISTFIIANTVKLAMFARRREIGIMKYIGSTNWFIRWPFVVEGVIIGIASSAVAIIAVGYGYRFFFNQYEVALQGIFQLIPLTELLMSMLWIYLFVGTLVGVIGSLISIRKYLDV